MGEWHYLTENLKDAARFMREAGDADDDAELCERAARALTRTESALAEAIGRAERAEAALRPFAAAAEMMRQNIDDWGKSTTVRRGEYFPDATWEAAFQATKPTGEPT